MNLECEKWIKHIVCASAGAGARDGIPRTPAAAAAAVAAMEMYGARRNRISISREIYTCRERGSRAINSFYSKHLFAIYVLPREHRAANIYSSLDYGNSGTLFNESFSIYLFPVSNWYRAADRRRDRHDLCSWFPTGRDKWRANGNNDQEPFRSVSRKIDFRESERIKHACSNNLFDIQPSENVASCYVSSETYLKSKTEKSQKKRIPLCVQKKIDRYPKLRIKICAKNWPHCKTLTRSFLVIFINKPQIYIYIVLWLFSIAELYGFCYVQRYVSWLLFLHCTALYLLSISNCMTF